LYETIKKRTDVVKGAFLTTHEVGGGGARSHGQSTQNTQSQKNKGGH